MQPLLGRACSCFTLPAAPCTGCVCLNHTGTHRCSWYNTWGESGYLRMIKTPWNNTKHPKLYWNGIYSASRPIVATISPPPGKSTARTTGDPCAPPPPSPPSAAQNWPFIPGANVRFNATIPPLMPKPWNVDDYIFMVKKRTEGEAG